MTYKTYKYIDTGSHGYLRVATKELVALGIADKISEHSMYSPNGNYAYLEEDCDAGIFINAMGGIDNVSVTNKRITSTIIGIINGDFPSYYSEYALTRFS